MLSVSDHLRARLHKIAPDIDSDSLAALMLSEWSDEFEQLMRNRLIMGSLRYGKLTQPRPEGVTQVNLGYIETRLEVYKKTGNTEMLVDIANLCLVEFVVGDHPRKHFKALERE